MERNEAAVQLRGVVKRYGAVTALPGLDLEIGGGAVTALLGPNGAGKSTAIGLMLGRIHADAGSVTMFGRTPRDVRARQRVGAMLQDASLPRQLTVLEQVRLFAGYYPTPMDVGLAIGMAGLAGLEHRRCRDLSGGQQRRVQFALSIVGQPDLLILDEPTAGLDLEARRALWTTIRERVAAGTGVILTTHHLDEAEALADRIIVIDGGRVIADDTTAGIKSMVASRVIRCRTVLDDVMLASLPAVRSIGRSGVQAVIGTAEPEATLRALLAADAGLSDLTVTGAGLEEAFDALTAGTGRATTPTQDTVRRTAA